MRMMREQTKVMVTIEIKKQNGQRDITKEVLTGFSNCQVEEMTEKLNKNATNI